MYYVHKVSFFQVLRLAIGNRLSNLVIHITVYNAYFSILHILKALLMQILAFLINWDIPTLEMEIEKMVVK